MIAENNAATRDQLSVEVDQLQEGRLGMRQVEEARLAEIDKWIAFCDAQYTLERRGGMFSASPAPLADVVY